MINEICCDIICAVIKMEIHKLQLGNLRSNCYIVYENHKGFIIDPGYESEDILRFIHKKELEIEGIYLTHGHFDHVGGVKLIKDVCDCLVYAPIKDKIWLGKSTYNQVGYEIPVDVWVKHGDSIKFFDKTFTVYETPGHSEGSTVLFGEQVLFSGDTLFFESIGRTDIPLSNSEVIYQSVKKIYDWFDEDVLVYPGHGRPTDIGHEKKFNPFIKG